MGNRVFKVKITAGTDIGPYNIYYHSGSGNVLATFNGTSNQTLNVPYNDLITGDGVTISIPDSAVTIILYNTRDEIIDSCATNEVIYNMATLVPTATPTATPTSTPTSTPTATPTATPTSTPTSTPTATPTSTPEPLKYPHNFYVNFNANAVALCDLINPSTITYYSYDETLVLNSFIYTTSTMMTPVNGQNLYGKDLDTSKIWNINTGGQLIGEFDNCPTPTPTPTPAPGPTPTATLNITYNCTPEGGCYGVTDGSGTYATYALCAANCSAQPTPTPTPSPSPPPGVYAYTFTNTPTSTPEDLCNIWLEPGNLIFYSYDSSLSIGSVLYTTSDMETFVNGYNYYNLDKNSSLIWQINTAGLIHGSYTCPVAPPTPTPTLTPTESPTIYTHYFTMAYNTTVEACFQTFSSIGLRSYDAILGVGSVIYQTTLMNDPLNGNDKWRLESSVGKSYKINTAGAITDVFICNAPTPTPTATPVPPTPTPTATPGPTPTPTSDLLQLVYTSTISGGPGGFSISVNGVPTVSTNTTDYGYINVPYNSLIDVNIQAPAGGTTPTFYTEIYAQDQTGIFETITTANASTSIQFYITSNTDVYGTASVSNDGEPTIQ